MADAKEKKEEAPPEAAAAPKGGSTLLVVGLVVSIVFGLAGFASAAYMMVSKRASAPEVTVEEAGAESAQGGGGEASTVTEEDQLDEGEQALGAIYPLETFVINLSEGRYLRAQVRLEFASRDVPKRFFTRLVPARDALIDIFSSKRAEDIRTSQGKGNLKKEIKDKINELLRHEDVTNVYFTQFVVQ